MGLPLIEKELSMTRLNLSLRSTLLALAVGATSFAAVAQTSAPQAPAAPGASAQASGPQGDRHERMHARVGRHLDGLKTRLQLNASQESAWSQFRTALQARPTHAAHATHTAQRQELMGLSTPERLDRMKTLRAQHQAEMNAFMDQRSEATKTFYATLSTEQKKVFDAESARFMQARHSQEGHGHPGRGHHGMMHGGRS